MLCIPTLHGRSHRVEDLEGRADVGTDAGDVLLLPAHVAVLRAAGLQRTGVMHRNGKRLKDSAALRKQRVSAHYRSEGKRWEPVNGVHVQNAEDKLKVKKSC